MILLDLQSLTALLRAEEKRERMEYIKLSAHMDFQELFVEKCCLKIVRCKVSYFFKDAVDFYL